MGGGGGVVFLLEDLLASRYEPPEWAFLLEFSGGVGSWHTGRRADAVAFNCWPSTGNHRLAFEIKRTRADFMREIDTPDKRKWLEKHFHQCYFVVVPGIVKPDEIPEGWGLLVATQDGGKLIRRKAAMHRDIGDLPEHLALSAIRAMSQNMVIYKTRHYTFEGEIVTQADIDAKVTKAVEAKQEMVDDNWARVRQLHRKMGERYSQLKAPLEELGRLAGEYGVFGYADDGAPSVEDVRRLVRKAEQQAVAKLVGQLRDTHRMLGRVLESVEEEGVSVETSRSLPKKQRFRPIRK